MKSSQHLFRNFALLVLLQIVFFIVFTYLFVAKIFAVQQLAAGMTLCVIVFAIGYWRVFRNMSREYWERRERQEGSIDDASASKEPETTSCESNRDIT